ncbi:MAG: alpha/beta hydrolase [Candidatus Paceibacteria bacterium]
MNQSKPQIVFIHGGDSFDNNEEFYDFLRNLPFDPYEPEKKRWRDELKEMTAESHEFIFLQMPNKLNAKYIAWSIWFEKLLPFIRDGAVLIGHSLGGSFLLRYLSEHALPVSIRHLHLVAPAIDDLDCPGLGQFSTDLKTWSGFKSDIKELHLWHSEDDAIVPIHHSERFLEVCPSATFHRFTDRFHFIGDSFPELLAEINK